MAITLAELKQKLQHQLAGIDPTSSTILSQNLTSFLQYGLTNYDQLAPDAKAYIDGLSEQMRTAFQGIVEKLPESPKKRQLVRALGVAGGVHFTAEHLIKGLESPPGFKHPILPAAKSAFTKLIQNTLDVLFDATRHTHQGVASFAKIGLCYWTIDELMVAIHSAQRAFANQSYAHIRTAFEILDLIELFDVQPDWANLWASGDDKKVWSELRPKSVRKKLGGPKVDPMYSFFSELGSHGTFRGLQARGVRIEKKGEKGEEKRKSFRIWVGGTHQLQHIVWTNSFCVYVALRLFVKSVHSFASYLNAEEIKDILESSSKLTAQFFIEHFVKWAKDEGLPYESALDFLKRAPWVEGQ